MPLLACTWHICEDMPAQHALRRLQQYVEEQQQAVSATLAKHQVRLSA